MKTGIKIVLASVVGIALGFLSCLIVVTVHEDLNRKPTMATYSLPPPATHDKRLSKMSFTLGEMLDAEASEFWARVNEANAQPGDVRTYATWNPRNKKELEQEIKCLAMNIYFEAGNQSLEGKLAVADVTRNRVLDLRYPNSLCGVVWQSRLTRDGTRRIAQFSWTQDGLPDIMRKNEEDVWNQCFRIARAMTAEGQLTKLGDGILGATHYHAHYVDPYWAPRLQKVATIGDHLFYRVGSQLPINKIPGAVAYAH